MAKVKATRKSPRIYRRITDLFKKSKVIEKLKFQGSVFLLGFLVMTAIILIIDLLFVFQKQKEADFERVKLGSEIKLWENIVQKYPSKDTYFKLAQLEYRVGDIQKSNYYTDKALYLDPNFTQA
ncbi:MAG TPA: hypothetical protein VFA93_03255, partial [Patescibacteria group bacterium]|nr:hypothetical protein [Patescibacteria group bacterium]